MEEEKKGQKEREEEEADNEAEKEGRRGGEEGARWEEIGRSVVGGDEEKGDTVEGRKRGWRMVLGWGMRK